MLERAPTPNFATSFVDEKKGTLKWRPRSQAFPSGQLPFLTNSTFLFLLDSCFSRGRVSLHTLHLESIDLSSPIVRNIQYLCFLCPETHLWLQQRQRRRYWTTIPFSQVLSRDRPFVHSILNVQIAKAFDALTVEADENTHFPTFCRLAASASR